MRICRSWTPIRATRSTSSSTATTINWSPVSHATSPTTGYSCSCATSMMWGRRRVRVSGWRRRLRAAHRSDGWKLLPALWHRPGTDRAVAHVVVPCRAILAAEVDDLQVPLSPFLARKELFQIGLRLPHVLAFRQAPADSEAMNVRVDGEGCLAERLRHDHARGLVPNAWQLLQLVDVARHLASVFIDQCLREPFDVPSFARRQSAASNQFQDFMLGHASQCGRTRRASKERGRDAVDLRIGRLR